MALDARAPLPVVVPLSPSADDAKDPYTDFELYLKKAQEEIGQVFEKVDEGLPKEDHCEGGRIEKLTHLESLLHGLSEPPSGWRVLSSDVVARKKSVAQSDSALAPLADPAVKVAVTTTPPTLPSEPQEAAAALTNGVGKGRPFRELEHKSPLRLTEGGRRRGVVGLSPSGQVSPPIHLLSPSIRENGSLVKRGSSGRGSDLVAPHDQNSFGKEKKQVVVIGGGRECASCRLPVQMPSSVATLPLGLARAGKARCLSTPSSKMAAPMTTPRTSSRRGRFASCLRPKLAGGARANADVDVDALSAWADDLAREMNSMGTEDVDDDDAVLDEGGRALVWWLLTDLPSVDSGHGAGDVQPPLEEVKRCMCSSSSHPRKEVESLFVASTLNGTPFVGIAKEDLSDSESEEVFEDALEYPQGWDDVVYKCAATIDSLAADSSAAVNGCENDDGHQARFQSTLTVDLTNSSRTAAVDSNGFHSCHLDTKKPSHQERSSVASPSSVLIFEEASQEEAPRSDKRVIQDTTNTHELAFVCADLERHMRAFGADGQLEATITDVARSTSDNAQTELLSLRNGTLEEKLAATEPKPTPTATNMAAALKKDPTRIRLLELTIEENEPKSRLGLHLALSDVSPQDGERQQQQQQQQPIPFGYAALKKEVSEATSEPASTPPTATPTPNLAPAPATPPGVAESASSEASLPNSNIATLEGQRSRLSSSASTTSSSGGHLKPADVQDFIRRVETSIWQSSGSIPRRNTKEPWCPGSEASPTSAPPCSSLTQTVATQTSPPLSRSSSFAWLGDGESIGSNLQLPSSEESVLSFSCSSLDAVSGPASNSDSASSGGESEPSADEVGCKRLNKFIYQTLSRVSEVSSSNQSFDGIEKEVEVVDSASALQSEGILNMPTRIKAMKPATTASIPNTPNVQVLHVYPPNQVPTGETWVRREDEDSQITRHNGFGNHGYRSNFTSEDSSTSQNVCENGHKADRSLSLSKMSTTWASAFPTNTGGRTPTSTHRRTVRETYSESNISEYSIRLAIEDQCTVKSERVVTSMSCCSGGSFTIPPSKVRPLILREVSSVSAPTSTLSSPMTDTPFPLHSPPSSAPARPSTLGLSRLDLTGKSSSAPILDGRFKRSISNGDPFSAFNKTPSPTNSSRSTIKVNPPPRKSQSVKELTELEAVEACKWLRAAGFPQYAQMFEDMQFPINIAAVQKDHYFLDDDSIQSLFRRLNALNRCARMRLDSIPRKPGFDDSDEEENCAISENWTFQRQSRRWSRIPTALDSCVSQASKNDGPTLVNGQNDSEDNVFVDTIDFSPKDHGSRKGTDETDIPESPIPMEEDGSGGSASVGSLSTQPEDSPVPEGNRTGSFRRTGSERLKDGARAFLRRMESLKTRRSKRRNREAVVISGPHVMDLEGMQRRMQHLACVDLTPPSSTTPSPQLAHHRSASDGRAGPFDDSSSLNSTSDTSQNSTPATQSRTRRWASSHSSPHHHHHCSDSSEKGAFSDSECSPPLWRAHKDANSNETKLIENYLHAEVVSTYSNGFAGLNDGNSVNFRTGSFTLGQDSASYREKLLERRRLKHSCTLQPPNSEGTEKRSSLYDNVPGSNNKGTEDAKLHQLCQQKGIPCHGCEGKMPEEKSSLRIGFYPDSDSGSSLSTNQDQSDAENQKPSKENNKNAENTDSSGRVSLGKPSNGNLRWQVSHQPSLLKRPRPSTTCLLPLHSLSAGQLMMLRKLSLLKLTALMERYSPSNRSGWSWIMPKFIKRMKAPDYKDKVVFGLPLSVVHQRSGQPLPPSIQAAMLYLRKNAMDSVGLFRKSGVRSRIQKLKNMNEANPDTISYEGQQTYDVADMLKQYFRELPEALLTNKMSETFISIYQYIPEDLRMDALQAAIMLMPDENREVLHKLLSFLSDVSQQAHENQMTASNLAVCFAPSLFHIGTARSSSSSPRRRKTVGVPDQKELNENRAAHECLTHMIKEFKLIFSVPEDAMFQCRYSYIDDTEPGTLEELGRTNGSDSGDWQSYINSNVQSFMKESRDKFKGWISFPTSENADLAFKKIGDGNPLRLWKASVEVEAPPVELLNRVLRERQLWDNQMLKWRVVSRLDGQSEIFQYVRNSMPPIPSRDYCVLRSWRTDLPKGACMLIEVSVNHPDSPVLLGDVRAVVLCSRYLIEPCGSGKSRIVHISRIDTRGRSPEWYNRVYGQVSALHLVRIGNTFRHNADGPESKV